MFIRRQSSISRIRGVVGRQKNDRSLERAVLGARVFCTRDLNFGFPSFQILDVDIKVCELGDLIENGLI